MPFYVVVRCYFTGSIISECGTYCTQTIKLKTFTSIRNAVYHVKKYFTSIDFVQPLSKLNTSGAKQLPNIRHKRTSMSPVPVVGLSVLMNADHPVTHLFGAKHDTKM